MAVRGVDGKFVAKRSRGRPPVYKGKDKKHILNLIRKCGLTGCQKVLAGEQKRVPTLPMLVRWAKQAEIAVKRGRPRLLKVAEAA